MTKRLPRCSQSESNAIDRAGATPFAMPLAMALAMASAALPAAAQEAEAQTADEEPIVLVEPLRDVVFSYGNRDQHPSTIGSAASVITAGELTAGQVFFVADALRMAPGVAVARNGGYGGFASARIRGGSSGQTVVVIDGVVVNDAAAPQGGFDFGNLDVADIERIEVLRGPQSLIWGADAIGGVIYIRTKDYAPAISGFVEGGSLGLARGGASGFVEAGPARIRATLSGVRSTGISRAASGSEKDGYRSIGGSLYAGIDLAPALSLDLNARLRDTHADLDGYPPPFYAFADTAETEDARDFAISARLSHKPSGGPLVNIEQALTLSASGLDREDYDAGATTFDARGRRMNAHYFASWRAAPALRLSGGAEFERISARVSGVDETANAGAGFLMAEVDPSRWLTVSAGLRRDEFSNFDGATTARLAAVATLAESGGDTTRLRASWGQGFRAPTLFELNFDQFGIIPNPNLRPERANGFDAGLEQEFDLANTVLRATYFRQRVKDQIDFDFAGNGYFNIDRVHSQGVEIEARTRLSDGLDFSAVYTLIDAKDAATGLAILRTPKHSGSATLNWAATKALLLSASAWFNGREADTPTPNDSFVKLDLRASYAVCDTFEIFARVENATDASYEDVSGYGEPGATAFAGIRFRR